MKNFEQKTSIIRRLFLTLIVISSFFLVETVVLFFSSQNLIDGLTQLNRINQTVDNLDKIRGLSGLIQEQMTVENLSLKENFKVINSAQAEINKLFNESSNLVDQNFPDLKESLLNVQRSMQDFDDNIASFRKSSGIDETQVLVTKALAMETQEQLNKTQISLNERSHQIFSKVYDNRFTPLSISLGLTALLILTVLYLGKSLSAKLARSLNNIFEATVAVAEGNLSVRAKILEYDEIGKLTHAFNKMTEHLENSTVSREYIASILESMLDSVFVVNSEGNIVRVNKNVSQTLEYKPEELIGKKLQIIFKDNYEVKKHKHEEETEAVTKSGHIVPVSIAVSPLEGQGQTAGFAVCVIRDITEIKEAETQLKNKNVDLTNANRELEAFSYSVSHDLRSPLRSVDGFSQALLEDYGESLNAEAKDYLARIRAAVQRMGKLIDDLLNLSRITRAPINRVQVNLSDIANEVVSELKAEDPARNVNVTIAPDLKAFADPSLMRVILVNLLGNAWKYTSKHSSANIEFGITEFEGRKNVYFVKDDGAGFDMAFLQKLFGAFQRLHPNSEFSGTGVGLATAQRIIHRHGGSIWAEGEVEKGATFYFTL